jgi:hypothetical protein
VNLQINVSLGILTFTVAISWLLAAVTAFVSVLKGNIPLHRLWMVRSYAITTTFVTARVFGAIPAIEHAAPGVALSVTWSVIVVTLVLTEFGLAWPSIFANKRP